MAYLIITTGGQEISRHELHSAVVVGRAADCDISIHDIMLSRKHCQIENVDGHWTIADLSSKNGTAVGEQKISQHALVDGDEIHVGKCRVIFHTGTLIPSPRRFDRPKTPVAPDPSEALAGTVMGLDFHDAPTLAMTGSLPCPQPKPRLSDSFAGEDIHSMLEAIASSSWDSIYETNARPLRSDRELPRPIVRDSSTATIDSATLRPRRRQPSMALQVTSIPEAIVHQPAGSIAISERALSRFARATRKRFRSVGRLIVAIL